MRAASGRPAGAVELNPVAAPPERDQRRDPSSRRRYPAEASMSDSDLLVLAPWALFIAGVVLLVVLGLTRNHGGGGRSGRRRSRSRRR
jgi:hypothetical protein